MQKRRKNQIGNGNITLVVSETRLFQYMYVGVDREYIVLQSVPYFYARKIYLTIKKSKKLRFIKIKCGMIAIETAKQLLVNKEQN